MYAIKSSRIVYCFFMWLCVCVKGRGVVGGQSEEHDLFFVWMLGHSVKNFSIFCHRCQSTRECSLSQIFMQYSLLIN